MTKEESVRKELPNSGDEADWCSRWWRHALAVFRHHSGLGRAVKRRMNKRFRRRARREIES